MCNRHKQESWVYTIVIWKYSLEKPGAIKNGQYREGSDTGNMWHKTYDVEKPGAFKHGQYREGSDTGNMWHKTQDADKHNK